MKVPLEMAKMSERHVLVQYIVRAELMNPKMDGKKLIMALTGMRRATFYRCLAGKSFMGLENWKKVANAYGPEILETWLASRE